MIVWGPGFWAGDADRDGVGDGHVGFWNAVRGQTLCTVMEAGDAPGYIGYLNIGPDTPGYKGWYYPDGFGPDDAAILPAPPAQFAPPPLYPAVTNGAVQTDGRVDDGMFRWLWQYRRDIETGDPILLNPDSGIYRAWKAALMAGKPWGVVQTTEHDLGGGRVLQMFANGIAQATKQHDGSWMMTFN